MGNNLAIDSDNPDFVVQGELAGEFATPTTSDNTTGRFQRNIQLNSAFLFGNMDDQISGGGGDSDVEHSDIVSWGVRPASRYVLTWGSAWFDHMTMGEINPRQFADESFFGYHNNTRGLTNSVLHNFNDGHMFYGLDREDSHETVGRTVQRYGVDTVNITGFEGELIAGAMDASDISSVSDIDPIRSDANPEGGLRYLTRMEPGSSLSKLASDGRDLGATVMTFVGKSGTLFGENGYDQETHIPMWPFPMESIIKEKFAQYSYTGTTYTGHYNSRTATGTGTIVGARGFAVEGQSLSNYVWGYLGNVVPPFNVTASAAQASVLLQWSASPSISQDLVTAYQVYRYDPDDNNKVLLATLGHNQLSYRVNDLLSAAEYHFVVTAKVDDHESGFSYFVTASTR